MARTDEGHELTERELAKLQKRISKIYADASVDVGEAAEKYFERFKKRDSDMLKHLNAGDITKDQYQAWRLSQMGRGNYFNSLQQKLASRMNTADEDALKLVNASNPTVYALNRNYAAFTIEGAGNNLDFNLWNEATVNRLLKDSPDLMPNYPIDRAISRGINLAYGKAQITKCVTSGILRGLSIPQMAKELQERVTTMGKTSAIRAARTAVTGAENAGRTDQYADAVSQGIKMEQEWMATLDSRTRDSHGKLDGTHVAVGKKFGNGLRYPGDPAGRPEEVYNCRCTLTAWFPELAKENSKRKTWKQWKEEKESANKSLYKQTGVDSKSEKFAPSTSHSNSSPKLLRLSSQENLTHYRNIFEKQTAESIGALGKEQIKNLTASEIEALKSWTGASYGTINNLMRNGVGDDNEIVVKWANDMLSAFSKSKLNTQIIARREAERNALKSFFGTDESDVIQKMIGEVVTDKGFFAATYFKDGGKANQDEDTIFAQLYVICEKDTHAICLESITNTPKEYEILINAGSSFIIKDIIPAKENSGIIAVLLEVVQ